MLLAEHQKEILARLRCGIRRERLDGGRAIPSGRKDVQQREAHTQREERRAEPQRRVGVLEGQRRARDARPGSGPGPGPRPETATPGVPARPRTRSARDSARGGAATRSASSPSAAGVGTRVALGRAGRRGASFAVWVGMGCSARHATKSRSFAIVVAIS